MSAIAGGCVRHGGVELSKIARSDHEAEVMVAETGLPRTKRVARGEHLAPLGPAILFARLLAAKGKVDPLARDLAIGRRERLGQHQLARQDEGCCRSGRDASPPDIP